MNTATLPVLPVHGTCRVMVHYYSPHGKGATTVTAEVFQGPTRRFAGSRTLTNSGSGPATGQVWLAYNLAGSPPTASEDIASVGPADGIVLGAVTDPNSAVPLK